LIFAVSAAIALVAEGEFFLFYAIFLYSWRASFSEGKSISIVLDKRLSAQQSYSYYPWSLVYFFVTYYVEPWVLRRHNDESCGRSESDRDLSIIKGERFWVL
jgi:phosphotransferase system  glucose/maltose/N-acetylglucosamine-specific IIC component